MENPNSPKSDAAQPGGNDNFQGQSALPPLYAANTPQVSTIATAGYPANGPPPYPPSAPPPGPYQAPPGPLPTFPFVAANQGMSRKTIIMARCLKLLLSLGVAFLVMALSFYIRARNNGDYDSDDDSATVFRVVPLAFVGIGLPFLLIGIIGVGAMYRTEQRHRVQGYTMLTTPTINIPINQGAYAVFPQQPVEMSGSSAYPRQQYVRGVNNV